MCLYSLNTLSAGDYIITLYTFLETRIAGLIKVYSLDKKITCFTDGTEGQIGASETAYKASSTFVVVN